MFSFLHIINGKRTDGEVKSLQKVTVINMLYTLKNEEELTHHMSYFIKHCENWCYDDYIMR